MAARRVPSHAATWRFHRAVERIEPSLTPLLAEHATSYWQRGWARREVEGERVEWTIDGELVLEFRFAESGPSELVVHDFSLFEPLRKAIRTRHVAVRFATAGDEPTVASSSCRRSATRSSSRITA